MLVFSTGEDATGSDDTWRPPDDQRALEMFLYMNSKDLDGMEGFGIGEENAASVGQYLQMSKSKGFITIANATLKALRRYGFQATSYDNFLHDMKVATDKYFFITVGMTELELRKWAAQSEFQLELEPRILHEWMKYNRDPLAMEGEAEDPEEYKNLTPDIWHKLHAPFLKNSPADIYKERRKIWRGDPTVGDTTLFKTSDRIKLIIDKLEQAQRYGGMGMSLADLCLIPEHPMESFFVMHYEPEKMKIYNHVSDGTFFGLFFMPIDEIRHYYGEYVAFYFGFLEYYSKALLIPTALGFVVFIIQLATNEISSPVSVVMAIVIILWAKMFVVYWLRQEEIYRCYWSQSEHDNERILPEFQGDYISSNVDGSLVPYEEPKEKARKRCVSTSVITLCLGVLVASVIGTVFIREGMEEETDPDSTSGTIGFVTAVQIILFDLAYDNIAQAMTKYENNQTATQYDNSLIMKSFIFRFINAFNALFYIAFFKYHSDVGCKYDSREGCAEELRLSLAVIFGTVLVFDKTQNVIWLKLQRQWNQGLVGLEIANKGEVYEQWTMDPFDSTFEHFNQLIIEFGYVTIFIVAFPLAPMFSLASCWLESRFVITKLTHYNQRPIPRGRSTIGTWITILDILGWIAAATNIALVCFVTGDLDELLGLADNNETKLIVFALTEHILLAIYFVLIYEVGEPTKKIKEHKARNAYVVDSLQNYSEEVGKFYGAWAEFGSVHLSRFLKIVGGKSRMETVQKFKDRGVVGKDIIEWAHWKDVRSFVPSLSKDEAKWAWRWIEELKRKERHDKDVLDKMVLLTNVTQQAVVAPKAKIKIGKFRMNVFDFAVFLEGLNSEAIERLMDAVAKHRNYVEREKMDKFLKITTTFYWSARKFDTAQLELPQCQKYLDALEIRLEESGFWKKRTVLREEDLPALIDRFKTFGIHDDETGEDTDKDVILFNTASMYPDNNSVSEGNSQDGWEGPPSDFEYSEDDIEEDDEMIYPTNV